MPSLVNDENKGSGSYYFFPDYQNIQKVTMRYEAIVKHLRKKVQQKELIRVGFYVTFGSMFSAKEVYRLMEKDPLFEVSIIIIPNNFSHSDKGLLIEMEKAYQMLSKEFNNVYKAYSKEQGFIDYTSKLDIIFFLNVYERMTHKLYTVEYALSKRVLTCNISYAIYVANYSNETMAYAFHTSMWKIFVDTEINFEDFAQLSPIKGTNTILIGCAKMDDIAHVKRIERKRKKIIIAPHHTVANMSLQSSNFLTYAPLFLKLPKLYPEVDFVFRPHPALFPYLESRGICKKEALESYINEWTSYSNTEYQVMEDFFDSFINSDALIHDCGTFMAAYLYANKPVCFMDNQRTPFKEKYNRLGLACLEQHEVATNEEEIIRFIDESLQGIDRKKEARNALLDKILKLNYPFVSQKIIDYIKKELKAEYHG